MSVLRKLMYSLLRPLLFSLDAERAHHLGLAGAQLVARFPALAGPRPRGTPVTVANLTFPSRIGLAAGLDKNALAPRAWYAFGFGHIELGTITPRPQPGNDKPRLFRLKPHEAIINRMGFNNDGAEVVAARLAHQKQHGLRPPIPIGISIGKNKTTPAEQAADDYAAAARILASHADYLAINISSPNTPGLRDLQSAAEVAKLLAAVKKEAPATPTFVKLSPEAALGDPDSLKEILIACATNGASGVIATNTLSVANLALLPSTSDIRHSTSTLPSPGGLSGKPIFPLSLQAIKNIKQHLPAGLTLIACGGIHDLPSARAMLDAGADLLQVYTAFIYQGPPLVKQLARL